MKKTFLFLMVLGLSFFVFISFFSAEALDYKINGVSYVASRDTISQKHVEPVKNVNANWTSIMPFGIMRDKDQPTIYYNTKRHWYGERYDGSKHSIELMHQNGLKVMLKPQVWIVKGAFTGHIDMKTEEEWTAFENFYEDMILLYAKLAEETKVEMYCIGTELNSFISARPAFWNTLISKVRKIYKGPLTYAENWDKINNVPFWNQLNYIGVDAYFPISDQKTPNLDDVKQKWQTINATLEALSKEAEKPILFTEFGYRSIDYAGQKPWDASDIEGQVNEQAQCNLLNGLFESVWGQPWFAGGFLWKWFHNPDQLSPHHDNRFCVHGKEAEKNLKLWYDKFQLKTE